MSLLRQLSRGLRILTRRRAADEDLADEVLHSVDQATAEFPGWRALTGRDASRGEVGGGEHGLGA
jgi:hypothetical protein